MVLDSQWHSAGAGDILIDDKGRVWPSCSNELRAHLHHWRSTTDLTSYALRNLGFARVRDMRIACRITFRPGWLSDATLSTAIRHMAEQMGGRFIIDPIGRDSRLGVVGDLDDAVAGLVQQATNGGNIKRASYFEQPLSLTHLKHPRLREMRDLVRRWRGSLGRLQLPSRRGVVVAGGDSRTMLLRIGHDKAVVEQAGDGYTAFGSSWAADLVGRSVSEAPDRAYASHAVDAYMRACSNAMPTLQLIEADLNAPGIAPVRLRYDRLLLPWTDRGALFVSASARIRLSIPVLAAT